MRNTVLRAWCRVDVGEMGEDRLTHVLLLGHGTKAQAIEASKR
jgi:hypothetical protein